MWAENSYLQSFHLLNVTVMSRFYILVVVASFGLIGSCTHPSTDENFPCEGVFFMEITDDIHKQVCSKNIEKYMLLNDALHLSVMNNELAGKVVFKISLEPFNGPGTYHFGQNYQHFCELIVQGSTDEFYKSTSGKFVINHADQKTLDADFEITVEGFYNKKNLHARGGIRL